MAFILSPGAGGDNALKLFAGFGEVRISEASFGVSKESSKSSIVGDFSVLIGFVFVLSPGTPGRLAVGRDEEEMKYSIARPFHMSVL